MAASASFKRKSSSSGASGIGRAATRLATGGSSGGGKAKTASVQHQFEEAAPAPVAGGPMTPPAPEGVPPAPLASVPNSGYQPGPSPTTGAPSYAGPLGPDGYPDYSGLGVALNSLPPLIGGPAGPSPQQAAWDAKLAEGTASLPTGVTYGQVPGVQYSGEYLKPGQLSGPSLPGYGIGSPPSNDRTKPFDPVAEQKFWEQQYTNMLEVQRVNAGAQAAIKAKAEADRQEAQRWGYSNPDSFLQAMRVRWGY